MISGSTCQWKNPRPAHCCFMTGGWLGFSRRLRRWAWVGMGELGMAGWICQRDALMAAFFDLCLPAGLGGLVWRAAKV